MDRASIYSCPILLAQKALLWLPGTLAVLD